MPVLAFLLLDGIGVFPGCKLHIRVAESVERGPLEAEPVSAANALVATRHERSALNLRFTPND